MHNEGIIHKISISSQKGQKKGNVPSAKIKEGRGIEGDAHSESDRPLSLLPMESFGKLRHPKLQINPGDFAENITTVGLDFSQIAVGTRLMLGGSVEIEITQIGKKCHNGCIIRELAGDCIMPREGVFAKVICGGDLKEGDPIRVVSQVRADAQ
ncbi:MAG: MOSC domain-containing protein [candidate division Zixibacteria bacterium CG_4_9_14_3_um_filter_46_8]|nr:MAG: MOSC domain-containing protein [candidate division Zixibacteria bacterium CG_4_9_14_3_um_filter_46_8]